MVRNLNLIKEIGKELRRIRNEKGVPLQEVAKQSDVTSMYISEIERNMKVPSDEVIIKLSKIYGVSPLDLFEGFGKVPDKTVQEIVDYAVLFETLYKVSHNEDIGEEKKNKFYIQVKEMYAKMVGE